MTICEKPLKYVNQGVTFGGSDSWRTPYRLLSQLDQEFNFTVDLAASGTNHVCERYYTAENSALEKSWKGERGFCNPPFSKSDEFLAKAHEADLCVCVVASRSQTVYFAENVFANPYCHEIRFLMRGVKFLHPEGKPAVRSPLPIAVVIYRHTVCRDKLIGVHCADTGVLLQHVAGQRSGRPLTHGLSTRDSVIQDYLKGHTVKSLVERYRVSRATVYRWVKGAI